MSSTRAVAMPRAAGAAPLTSSVKRSKPWRDPALAFLYVLWFIALLEPHWYLARQGLTPITKLPTILFGIFLLMTMARGPRTWYAPLLAFLAYTVVMLPFVFIGEYALMSAKRLFLYYVLAVGTVAYIRRPGQAMPALGLMFLGQFAFLVVLGALNGRIDWHPIYNNFDGFGPMMVIGFPLCVHYGLATTSKRTRRLAFALAAGCLFGLISSFARGAVVSGVAVIGWMWLRSKRKGKALAVLAVLAPVLVVVVNVFFSNVRRSDAKGNFWAEMATITAKGGTRGDREILWDLAMRTYKDHPLFGVGAENFGPYAATTFKAGTIGDRYDYNPLMLWQRALHSTYYQLLAEFGTVGSLIFLWMLWDFWRRNRQLMREARRAAWTSAGGVLDLRHLALGLEGAMLGWLTTGAFYNQIFNVPWFYEILTANLMLHLLSRPSAAVVPPRPPVAAVAPGVTASR